MELLWVFDTIEYFIAERVNSSTISPYDLIYHESYVKIFSDAPIIG